MVTPNNSLNFRYSYPDKILNNKAQRRTWEIHLRTNVVILNEYIDDNAFNESDLFEEDEATMSNISILDIYIKAELIDNNSTFKWVSKSFFNDSGYCN